MTDKDLIKERFEQSFARYDRQAHVQQRICALLAQRIGEVCRRPVARAFEIGVGTGFLTSRLTELFPDAEWVLNDITSAAEKFVAKYMAGVRHEYLWGDAEKAEYPTELDLVVSSSTIQWFEDKEAFARRTAGVLNTGGLLAVSLFGVDHFREVRATTGEGLKYHTVEQLGEILDRAGFDMLHAEDYAEVLTFDKPLDVLAHIRELGVNSVKKTSWGPGRLAGFEDDYIRQFSTPEGKVTLTYHPLLLIAGKR